jgi:hypothetical protein
MAEMIRCHDCRRLVPAEDVVVRQRTVGGGWQLTGVYWHGMFFSNAPRPAYLEYRIRCLDCEDRYLRRCRESAKQTGLIVAIVAGVLVGSCLLSCAIGVVTDVVKQIAGSAPVATRPAAYR